ncbi:MAG: hypothetical protein BMS9Abin11_0847 [Gammaproteobacteria bacterium]|nr:MAG: hypothetical protein BMS9Abin11_0847 [Gammaproteobacteria bacterium]
MSKVKKSVWITAIIVIATTLVVGIYYLDHSGAPSYKHAMQAFLIKSKASGKGPKFSKEEYKLMADKARELKARLPNPGLKVGSKAPDFMLANAFGKNIRLSDYLKKGPVVLVFYRGAWCPFCNLHLHALHESLSRFKKLGASLILVTPQKPDKSAAQIKKDGYQFEVLSDLESKVMQSYNLYFELDPQLVKLYKAKGLDIEAFNGKGRNVLPVPGSFVIAPDGTIVAMHADTDYKQRMEPAAIIAALKSLKNQPEITQIKKEQPKTERPRNHPGV